PAAVPAAVPTGVTGAQLIALVEEAGRKGTMVGFTFHGIGGDYLPVSTEAHEELLAFLAANRDRYWTTTFLEQMQWVRAKRAEAAAKSAQQARCTVRGQRRHRRCRTFSGRDGPAAGARSLPAPRGCAPGRCRACPAASIPPCRCGNGRQCGACPGRRRGAPRG